MKSGVAFLRRHGVPTVLCFGVAALLGLLPWMQRIENTTLDSRTRFREPYQAPPEAQQIVVSIDDVSIEDFGIWPWERSVHGGFMALAAAGKASVVAWDILFSEPDHLKPANDEKLAAGTTTARSAGTEVVFGAVTSETLRAPTPKSVTQPMTRIEGDVQRIGGDVGMYPPIEALQERAPFGMVDTPPGTDGTRRFVPLLVRAGGQVYPSLALQAVLRHWKVNTDQVRIRLGDAVYLETPSRQRRIPIDAEGRYLVNYRFGAETANRLPFAGLYSGLREVHVLKQPDPDLPEIKGRILLVGQVSTALTDNGPSPFSPNTPLVIVHANVVDNILRGDFARHAPFAWVMLGCLALGMGGLAWFSERKFWEQAIFTVLIPAGYVSAATWVWIKASVWLPLVWPLVGFVALQAFMISRRLLAEQRAKQQIKGMFGTYLSPQLVNRMIDSGETPKLGGHAENITAYFSDIQGYSTFSEKLPPERLVGLLNDYLTACTEILQEEGGTLDKYIGDAVIMMFGAPIALPDHAYRACVASLRVQARIGELRERWTREGDIWPLGVRQMRSRIGLNTGEAIIGNMGSTARFAYTMTGDNVNLAARMESGAKSWGVYTMATEATRLACVQHGGERVVFRPLGRVIVKGRGTAVPIHEIVGLRENLTDPTRECLALFMQALEKFHAGDWVAAREGFLASGRLEPLTPETAPGVSSNPSQVFAALAQSYRLDPPAPDWDGVVTMHEK